MDIISYFYNFLKENFNHFIKNYFKDSNFWNKTSDINNYINFMTNLDNFNTSFMQDIIKCYLEYIDNVFFDSSYRRRYCSSKGFYKRTILTLFGEITFKRRYYYDNNTDERFFFTDFFLGLPKRKYFDPFICADICEEAASSNYSKTGKIIASKIGNRINNKINISRASARNIVMQFDISENDEFELKRIERLFIMLDEKFVGSQFNNGVDHMIKASVIFEDTELVYKYKRKPNSVDRYKLVNSHTCASIDDNLLHNVLDYIYTHYDVNYIKEIDFMGDCALWIKNFPKSYWFNFTKDTHVNFAMDGFHFSQSLKHLTTNKYPELYNILYEYVRQNNKKDFIRLCNEFKDLHPERSEIIEEKMNYILNNWNARQTYQNKPYMKCSMESHISHIFADLFTSRPKAYSEKGLRQLLKLRLLKVNKNNIKQMYFESLTKTITSSVYKSKYSDSSLGFNKYPKKINFSQHEFINQVNFFV